MMNRRHFIGSMTALTTAAGLGLGGVFVARQHLSLAEFKSSVAQPLHRCQASLERADGQSLHGVFEDVTTVRRAGQFGAPCTEQISLLFATRNTELVAGPYNVKTDQLDLGTLDFQLVEGTGSQQRLEAVINRIV